MCNSHGNDTAICITDAEYEANLSWVAKSYQAALAGELISCRGCENTFPLLRLFRCFHCGSYFCPNYARAHFGERPGRLFEVMTEPVEVVCLDEDCQSRDDCPHSEPHTQIEECTYVCGADEPCSRCFPVDTSHG